MDLENVYQGVSYSRHSFKRTFVCLDKEEAKASSGKKLEDLRKGVRVADITFTWIDPPSHIGRLLIANFALLVGIDLTGTLCRDVCHTLNINLNFDIEGYLFRQTKEQKSLIMTEEVSSWFFSHVLYLLN